MAEKYCFCLVPEVMTILLWILQVCYEDKI